MKKLKTLSIYISSYRIWVLTLLGIDLFFAFLIWAVCPNNFVSYIGLILLVFIFSYRYSLKYINKKIS